MNLTVMINRNNQTFDLKIKGYHSDLYFMVNLFCLISRRPSDE